MSLLPSWPLWTLILLILWLLLIATAIFVVPDLLPFAG
jgi:hypothetical protein